MMMVIMLCIPALASDFDHCADALNDLGLFQGTDAGYELDRAPNRLEAGAMLVRLLGKEDVARQLDYTAPFTDVPDWAKPYVQYLYENGLTSGATATTFGGNDLCTAQQYATFLLRALGYSDQPGGDFTYTDALSFAQTVGVADDVNCSTETFLRDNMVAMSYTALSIAPKSGEADLLTKLVSDGSIPDAKGYDKKFQLFREYCAINTSDDTESMSMRMEMDMDMKMGALNLMTGTVKADIGMAADLNHMDQTKMALEMAMKMKIDDDFAAAAEIPPEEANAEMKIACYYTNGYLYFNMDGMKLKASMSFEDAMTQVTDTDQLTNTVFPISLLEDISADTANGTTTYHITYSDGVMNGIAELAMGMMEDKNVQSSAVKFHGVHYDITVKNGQPISMDMTMGMQVTEAGDTMDMNVHAKIYDIRTGSTVRVVLPSDLDAYVEMTDATGTTA